MRPALNYNNKESYGQNIYIKPMFYIQCNHRITRNYGAKTCNPTNCLQCFLCLPSPTSSLFICTHDSMARVARQCWLNIDINNAEVKHSVTDYSDSPPHHQSYSSQGTSYGFKCIGNRSICINIHLFFSLEEWYFIHCGSGVFCVPPIPLASCLGQGSWLARQSKS